VGKSGKTPERLFSLVRLSGGGGDWLLPDNNEKTLRRLRLHDEETTGGTVRRWRIWRRHFEVVEASHRPPNISADNEWENFEGSWKTRDEAINSALTAGGGEGVGVGQEPA
jgi:hypothetical protein